MPLRRSRNRLGDDVTRRVHPNLAGRTHDWFAQDLEAAELSQGEAEVDFFAGKILFIETAGGLEQVAPRENERTRSEPEGKIDGGESVEKNIRPKGHLTVGQDARAAAGVESDVVIWRIADGVKLKTLTGHSGSVFDLAFAPDGLTIASSSDKTIKLWQLKRGATAHPDRSHLLCRRGRVLDRRPDARLRRVGQYGAAVARRGWRPAEDADRSHLAGGLGFFFTSGRSGRVRRLGTRLSFGTSEVELWFGR